MNTFPLLPFVLATVVAQEPQPVKVPRPPAEGVAKSHAPLPVKHGVPTTIGIPNPTEAPARPRAVANRHAVEVVSRSIARQLDDPNFVAIDTARDGTVWALGAHYKAAFLADGWRFFGQPDPTATELQPIDIRLARVSIAGTELALGEPRRTQTDRHVEYDRGPVVEAIDLAGGGVEQTFTFATLPARGELVVECIAATALTGETTADGILFTGPHDRLRYSPAIAIDATGARTEAPTALVDGRLQIRVPSNFLERAVLPLRIDPLLSSIPASTSVSDVAEPDIAWDESGAVWAVVFSRFFGGSDWDCFVQRVSNVNPMSLVGGATTIDFTTSTWQRPRIANLNAYDKFMVVAQVKDTGTPWRIEGRIMDNAGVTSTGAFVVHSSLGGDLHPDIGGDPDGAPTFFTVVWEHTFQSWDHDILARQVEPNGVLRGAGPIVVDVDSANQTWPAISKSCGVAPASSQRFGIVYQQTFSPTDEDIYGAMLTWDGNPVTVAGNTKFAVDVTAFYCTNPQVSSPTVQGSNGLRYLLAAYERDTNSGDIIALGWDQAGNYQGSANISILEQSPLRLPWRQARASVDSDGQRFVVGYTELFNNDQNLNDLDTRVTTVALGGGNLIVEEAGVSIATSPNREQDLQIASRYSGSGFSLGEFATCSDREAPAGGSFAIDAQLYFVGATGLFTTRPTGCGSLSLGFGGQAVPAGTVHLITAPDPNIQGFVLGAPANTPIGPCPGCTLGVNGFLQLGRTWSFTIPFDPSLVGFTFSGQGFVFQPSGAPCLNQIQLSDTVDITIG